MKPVKRLLALACLVPILLCSSCKISDDRKYTCDVTTVDSVQIVQLDSYNKEEDRFSCTVLAKVENRDAFLQQLCSLRQSRVFNDPLFLKPTDIVIRVLYQNGDFDLIRNGAQKLSRNGKIDSRILAFSPSEKYNALIDEALKFPSLTSLLTEQYSLSELEDFFLEKEKSSAAPCIQTKNWSRSEVANRFPIGADRPEGYTVFRVAEGGYYYVFWRDWDGYDLIFPDSAEEEPTVQTRLYLRKTSSEEFSSIKENVSTAADVEKIDPYGDFFLSSSGELSSTHFLDQNHVVNFDYITDATDPLGQRNIVKNIYHLDPPFKTTRINAIRKYDLPQ